MSLEKMTFLRLIIPGEKNKKNKRILGIKNFITFFNESQAQTIAKQKHSRSKMNSNLSILRISSFPNHQPSETLRSLSLRKRRKEYENIQTAFKFLHFRTPEANRNRAPQKECFLSGRTVFVIKRRLIRITNYSAVINRLIRAEKI